MKQVKLENSGFSEQKQSEECKECVDFVEAKDGKYCRRCGQFKESKMISESNQYIFNKSNVVFFASRNYDNKQQILANQLDYEQVREQKIAIIIQKFLNFQNLPPDYEKEIKNVCLRFLANLHQKAKLKLITAVIFVNFLKKHQINIYLDKFLSTFDISGHLYFKYLQKFQQLNFDIVQYKSSNCLQIKPLLEQFSAKLAQLFIKKDIQWQLKQQKDQQKIQNDLKLQISQTLKKQLNEVMEFQEIDLFFKSSLQYQGIQSLLVYLAQKLYKIKFKTKDLSELISEISLKTLNKQLKKIEKIMQIARSHEQQLQTEISLLGNSKSNDETQDENMDFSQINFDKQLQD